MGTVRRNLMTIRGYTPYCGGDYTICRWPRAIFNGKQFACPCCKWVSNFDDTFIKEYKTKWA